MWIQASLAVTCLLSGEFAGQANLAGLTRDAFALALTLALTLCSHSHSFEPWQNLYVNICSFHSNAPAVATNNKLTSQWTHGAGRWSCNRLKLWPDAARGWPLVVAPSATADNTTDTRARAIAMQLWSVWYGGANQAGGEECRARPWLWNCSSFLSGCSWSQIEIENKIENRLKRLALFAFFGASMATRLVAPIKRSLTAVGYLIVGGLSRYAYQVDSFWVLKFF